MYQYSRFRRLGELLFRQGLVSLSAGNLSMRSSDTMYITASGSFLGDLKFNDIVEVPLEPRGRIYSYSDSSGKASVEAVVHRNIYLNTPHRAVAHGHAPNALALAAFADSVRFEDAEGSLSVPEVPVITVGNSVGSEEVAASAGKYLNSYPAVIIRCHGVFAAGETLRQACSLLSTIDFSARITILKKLYSGT